MNYRKKTFVLCAIIALLALTYIFTLIFNPENVHARAAAYSWLNPSDAGNITEISIISPFYEDEEYNSLLLGGFGSDILPIRLSKRGNDWFIEHNRQLFPAINNRVENFIALLSTRASYEIRSSNESSHIGFSVNDEAATRITVKTDDAEVLSLLVGQSDNTGLNIFLRKKDQAEVRMGEDKFTFYTESQPQSWFDLRLFPEGHDSASLQRLIVNLPEEMGASVQEFTRSGRVWSLNFLEENQDNARVESYIRDILGISADDFFSDGSVVFPMVNYCRLELQFGDGSVKVINIGQPDESETHNMTVSDKSYIYSISQWTRNRLIRGNDYFAK